MSKGPKTALKLLAVALALIVVGVLLYRQRVISESAIWGSDLLVFFLPAAAAFFANALIIAGAFPGTWRADLKGLATVALALATTFIAVCVEMTIALNMYGS